MPSDEDDTRQKLEKITRLLESDEPAEEPYEVNQLDEDHDDDKTPAERPGGPLSGIAINLLDMGAITNALASSFREAARQIDQVEGLSRRALLAQLYQQVSEVNRDLGEYGKALKTEALRV